MSILAFAITSALSENDFLQVAAELPQRHRKAEPLESAIAGVSLTTPGRF